MAKNPVTQIVEQFKREPSRTGSLIITFYGDAVLPRGGVIWLGTLITFLGLFGVAGNAVRTAMSRLAADGWLESDKVGRESFYRLASAGSARFEVAIEHVYRPHSIDWTGGLELILISNGADREASRAALFEAGFGSPLPGVWVAPAGTAIPSAASDAIRLEVSADNKMGRRLISEGWPLPEIANAYQEFVARFGPLQKWLLDNDQLTPADAIVARILLIHQYRRVLLRDPLLPAGLLPLDWPAAAARALCGDIYRILLPRSEQWLNEFGRSAAGKLRPPGKEVGGRFGES